MRCGSKCFKVEMEINGRKQTEFIRARTPASVRKTVRSEYGENSVILSVQKE